VTRFFFFFFFYGWVLEFGVVTCFDSFSGCLWGFWLSVLSVFRGWSCLSSYSSVILRVYCVELAMFCLMLFLDLCVTVDCIHSIVTSVIHVVAIIHPSSFHFSLRCSVFDTQFPPRSYGNKSYHYVCKRLDWSILFLLTFSCKSHCGLLVLVALSVYKPKIIMFLPNFITLVVLFIELFFVSSDLCYCILVLLTSSWVKTIRYHYKLMLAIVLRSNPLRLII
jgi:hypothetical protein